MNKFILQGMLCMLIFGVKAQKPQFKLKINPYTGYETNLLKSPSGYISTDNDTMGINELWTNAPFVGANNSLSIFDTQKRHTVEFKGNYRKSLINPESEVTASDFLTGFSYRYDTKKKVKNELKFGFRNYVKTGEDLDNIIGVPLSYKRLNLSNMLRIKLSKKALFTITPASIFKFYERNGFNEFMYTENMLETSLTYRYKYKKKVGFGLFTTIRQRDYTIAKEVDFEEPEEVANRKWRYYSGALGIRMPVNDKLKLTYRAGYTFRQDILQSTLGYHQYQLKLLLNYKNKKWKIDLGASAFYRDYTDFTVKVNNDTVGLRYVYAKYNGNVTYSLTDNFNFILRSSAKIRHSNVNDVNRRTFRSYMIGEASFGFAYTISSKKKV